MKLILLGAPGAGKGTQAERISERLGIPVVGTGNLLREEMKADTPQGREAGGYINAGNLVPDELVIQILKGRIAQPDCAEGYVLDGFPRTLAQAEALDDLGIIIDRVIDLEVEDDTIVTRMAGRRTCKRCGASYHLEYNPPKMEGTCDRCGSALTIRCDDKPETVRERLRVYHQQTEPLKDYYHAVGKLFVVEGQEEVDDTTRLTFAALEAETV